MLTYCGDIFAIGTHMKSLYCQCMTKPTTIKKKEIIILYTLIQLYENCAWIKTGGKEDLLESPKGSSRSLGLLHHSVVVQLLSRVRLFCDPMDCNPSGSSVHGISQARILEWVAIPPPGDLPEPGIKPRSPALQVDSLPSDPPGKHHDSISITSTPEHAFVYTDPFSSIHWDPTHPFKTHLLQDFYSDSLLKDYL